MNNDPTPLQERIERELEEMFDGGGFNARDMARDLTPLIAAEVRKAQAGALRDAADEDSETLYSVAGWEMQAVEAGELRHRAATIEKED